MLVVMLKEDSTLPINSAVGPENQIVGRVMGIGGSQPLKNDISLICLVVPIIVTEKKKIAPRSPKLHHSKTQSPGDYEPWQTR